MRILLIEDEEILAEAMAEMLRGECYAVDVAADGETASELMAINPYDLVVLDWSIPAPDGLTLLRQWRSQDHQVPVLMLSGRGAPADKVRALDAGADDYLTKPFAFPELLARARSLLRRRNHALQPPLAVGDIEMDRPARAVTVAGRPVELTPKEFAMLEYFLIHPGEVVTRTELTEHVWDDAFDSLSNVVDVTVYRLRKKIDGGRRRKLLHTLKGVGYMLREEPAPHRAASDPGIPGPPSRRRPPRRASYRPALALPLGA